MTQPEENAPKTTDTDQVLPDARERGGGEAPDDRTEMQAALEDEMERTNTSREDFSRE